MFYVHIHVRIIYFGVGMRNTVSRVKQRSLRYLYPLRYSCVPPLSFLPSFIFIYLSFRYPALLLVCSTLLYKHLLWRTKYTLLIANC